MNITYIPGEKTNETLLAFRSKLCHYGYKPHFQSTISFEDSIGGIPDDRVFIIEAHWFEATVNQALFESATRRLKSYIILVMDPIADYSEEIHKILKDHRVTVIDANISEASFNSVLKVSHRLSSVTASRKRQRIPLRTLTNSLRAWLPREQTSSIWQQSGLG